MLDADGRTAPSSAPAERDAAPSRPDVVVSEFCLYDAIRLLRQAGLVEYDPSLARDSLRLAGRLAGARALVVRNQTRVAEPLLAGAPHLEVVGRLGTGLDNIDLEACARRGVRVVYAPAANASAVAEMTLALAFALAKELPLAVRLGRTGSWSRSTYHGWELAGKVWGILGLGAVGVQVARRARALGMHVIAHHPRRALNDSVWDDSGAEPASRQAVLEQSDVLSLHLPLTAETRLSVGAADLAVMKSTAVLINTARGGILDETALAEALESGRLAGAALDVREVEPPLPGDRLQSLENVILTPHLAGLTPEAQRRVCLGVANDVLRVLAGETPLHAV